MKIYIEATLLSDESTLNSSIAMLLNGPDSMKLLPNTKMNNTIIVYVDLD